ncbi:hypothetical protein V8E53_000010 [Lactarius tabidus]
MGTEGIPPAGGRPHRLLPRWVAQTRENYPSFKRTMTTPTATYTASMGPINPLSGRARAHRSSSSPGAGIIQSNFTRRGIRFSHDDELITPSHYRMRSKGVQLLQNKGPPPALVTYLRFTLAGTSNEPYVFLATRASDGAARPVQRHIHIRYHRDRPRHA